MPEPDQDETTDETLEIGDMPAYADQTPAETGVAEEGDEGEREDTPHAAVGAVSDGDSPEVESEGIGSREEADESEVASEEASEAPVATTLAAIGTATMASSRPPLKMEKTRRALAKMIAPPQVPRDARGRPLSEKQIVDGLDRRERVFSIGAGLLALALGIVLAILYIHTRSEPLKKGQVRLTTGAAVALILVIVLPAIAMLIGVAAKRRAAVGFCALMLGFALSSIGLGIIPLVLSWGLAAWLLTRAYR
ncbi:MAG TPA: hypothetical protein VGS21_08035, partial [Acidimicrobiales bacterium]|nr:hypothetical protein [Acidimicrobiales bacterium]